MMKNNGMDDRGLSIEEVTELIEYINKNNSWDNNGYILIGKDRKCAKYFDIHFDTRTNTVWAITFREVIGGDRYGTTEEFFFRIESHSRSLKDRIYEWLDEKIKEDAPTCGEAMNFPKDPKEFLKQYSFKDKKEEYTNGSELIPAFRVEQMIEHYLQKDK